ncbi:[acyl-carrier-protein] S-malonyltransferase [Virgibacillus natechei]|uniref:Malonyl CoA-acyl carrier protein transacylase n=1 Tax=Virgibacillus natechei TaxID=1216297 RepID=A0ABS4ICS3_9BACI|nr:ACP S-malonyltransferase [Virgibacillus natechei]MBP1968136.1 [acyl-carrier-protein] S-malonyltransferase [Virgibacillus natechei]UZD14585.1 ACP S-malonyltransferase [Virgibacillus natechei]
MKRVAVMFPGQGSQAVGMGKEFYDHYSEVQALYQEANKALDKDITRIMFEGPKETLTETENAQPALLLSSIAVHTLLLKEKIQPVMAIGHSLGEYSALVAAGSVPLDEALPLVATRGKLMEEAFPKGQGTMAAVLGMSAEEIEKSLQKVESEVVDIANLNSPGQIVISGSKAGIEQASTILKDNGAKRVLPLNVSGPFHSRLMKSANNDFASYLNSVDIKTASIPVYANVSATPVTESDEIKDLLIKQLYSPVRFEESIRYMIDRGVDAFVEVGNGKVLSGLVKKIDRSIPTFAVQDIDSMNDFISWYREGL